MGMHIAYGIQRKDINNHTIMRKHIYLLAILMAIFIPQYSLSQEERALAFPGAEGWGRHTTGGRGGRIVFVTNTLDYTSGEAPIEGSFRAAMHNAGNDPITVVFRTSGRIDLKEVLKVTRGNITIAGQTAPGEGICLSGRRIYFSGENYIIRYLRFRSGDGNASNESSLDIENARNVIVDHCSMSWSVEENVTMYDNKYTTMQWCILSEPLYKSCHNKGNRGYGAQWGGEHSTYHHNLIAHTMSRAPRLNGVRDDAQGHDYQVTQEVVNNVIYNWGKKEAVYGGELYSSREGAYCHNILLNNYYKPGPATWKMKERWFARLSYSSGSNHAGEGKYGLWYIEGNYMEEQPTRPNPTNDYFSGEYDEINNNNWYNSNTSNKNKALDLQSSQYEGDNIYQRLEQHPEEESGVTTTSAIEAYEAVLSGAGCRIPCLDAIDSRIIEEAAGRTAPIYGASYGAGTGIIDSQTDVGGYPTYTTTTAPVDEDNDGMADEWEQALDIDNPNGYDLSDHYTNIEMYFEHLINGSASTPQVENDDATHSWYDAQAHALTFSAQAVICHLNIYSVSGTLVAHYTPRLCATTCFLPPLDKGIYIAILTDSNGTTHTHKIAIE